MKTLFYLIAPIFIIYEMSHFSNPGQAISFKKKLTTTPREEMKDVLSGSDYLGIFTNLLYFFWILIGLMSFNWLIFLVLLIMSFIPKGYNKYAIKLDSLISALLIMFALINEYHLRINLLELFV